MGVDGIGANTGVAAAAQPAPVEKSETRAEENNEPKVSAKNDDAAVVSISAEGQAAAQQAKSGTEETQAA